jgi:hypothetical protein
MGEYQWVKFWFSPGTPVSSNNKTDRHDIAEILLKVALTTINNQPIFNKEMESLSKVWNLLINIIFNGQQIISHGLEM